MPNSAAQSITCGRPVAGHVEQRQQIVIPVILMDVIEACAAGIGGVGDMHPAAGQTPDEKAVDRAETQLAGSGTVARALDLV